MSFLTLLGTRRKRKKALLSQLRIKPNPTLSHSQLTNYSPWSTPPSSSAAYTVSPPIPFPTVLVLQMTSPESDSRTRSWSRCMTSLKPSFLRSEEEEVAPGSASVPVAKVTISLPSGSWE